MKQKTAIVVNVKQKCWKGQAISVEMEKESHFRLITFQQHLPDETFQNVIFSNTIWSIKYFEEYKFYAKKFLLVYNTFAAQLHILINMNKAYYNIQMFFFKRKL